MLKLNVSLTADARCGLCIHNDRFCTDFGGLASRSRAQNPVKPVARRSFPHKKRLVLNVRRLMEDRDTCKVLYPWCRD
jgi:hypothetical protein